MTEDDVIGEKKKVGLEKKSFDSQIDVIGEKIQWCKIIVLQTTDQKMIIREKNLLREDRHTNTTERKKRQEYRALHGTARRPQDVE